MRQLLICLALAGCGEVHEANWRHAERMCASLGGVLGVGAESSPASRTYAWCKDGTRVSASTAR